SKNWGTQEEHMFRYMLSLHQSGLSVSVAAPAGSPALYKAKEARVYFYKIGFTSQNFLSALFFARYLRVYRIGSVISGEHKAPSYAMLCARLARMPQVLVHQVSFSEVEQPVSFRHFYYKNEVQTFAAKSNLNAYIHVLNFYKLIANSNFVQTPGQFSVTSMDKISNKTREKDTVKNSE
ncbi:MAG: hypothetical protein N2662_03655, partial [Bacteroidales bacterium]|nr:hypothetical protein [Bacteroidales bacterium]